MNNKGAVIHYLENIEPLFKYTCIVHKIDYILRHKNVLIKLLGPKQGKFHVPYSQSNVIKWGIINETKKCQRCGYYKIMPGSEGKTRVETNKQWK